MPYTPNPNPINPNSMPQSIPGIPDNIPRYVPPSNAPPRQDKKDVDDNDDPND